jgi:hypothetical protein
MLSYLSLSRPHRGPAAQRKIFRNNEQTFRPAVLLGGPNGI